MKIEAQALNFEQEMWARRFMATLSMSPRAALGPQVKYSTRGSKEEASVRADVFARNSSTFTVHFTPRPEDISMCYRRLCNTWRLSFRSERRTA